MNIRSLMIDEDEMPIDVIGGNASLADLQNNGEIKENYMILSQRRLYFNGLMRNNRKEVFVDLEDITATSIENYNPIWKLVIGVVLLIAAIVVFIAVDEGIKAISIPLLILSIIFIIFYYCTRIVTYSVYFYGEYVAISIKMAAKDVILQFNRKLHIQKDYLKDQR